MNKEKLEKAIQKAESKHYWHFTGKGKHYGYVGYWFVDADYIPHWLSTWVIRKYAKEIE